MKIYENCGNILDNPHLHNNPFYSILEFMNSWFQFTCRTIIKYPKNWKKLFGLDFGFVWSENNHTPDRNKWEKMCFFLLHFCCSCWWIVNHCLSVQHVYQLDICDIQSNWIRKVQMKIIKTIFFFTFCMQTYQYRE